MKSRGRLSCIEKIEKWPTQLSRIVDFATMSWRWSTFSPSRHSTIFNSLLLGDHGLGPHPTMSFTCNLHFLWINYYIFPFACKLPLRFAVRKRCSDKWVLPALTTWAKILINASTDSLASQTWTPSLTGVCGEKVTLVTLLVKFFGKPIRRNLEHFPSFPSNDDSSWDSSWQPGWQELCE